MNRNPPTFSKLLDRILVRTGLEYRCHLADALGFTRTAMTDWHSGHHRPTRKSCQRIADFANIPVEVVLIAAGLVDGAIDLDALAVSPPDLSAEPEHSTDILAGRVLPAQTCERCVVKRDNGAVAVTELGLGHWLRFRRGKAFVRPACEALAGAGLPVLCERVDRRDWKQGISLGPEGELYLRKRQEVQA